MAFATLNGSNVERRVTAYTAQWSTLQNLVHTPRMLLAVDNQWLTNVDNFSLPQSWWMCHSIHLDLPVPLFSSHRCSPFAAAARLLCVICLILQPSESKYAAPPEHKFWWHSKPIGLSHNSLFTRTQCLLVIQIWKVTSNLEKFFICTSSLQKLFTSVPFTFSFVFLHHLFCLFFTWPVQTNMD